MGTRFCNTGYWEAEAEGSQVWGQPRQLTQTLSQNTTFKKGLGTWLSGRAQYLVLKKQTSHCILSTLFVYIILNLHLKILHLTTQNMTLYFFTQPPCAMKVAFKLQKV
jgi:hypothetical protein